MFIVIFKFNIKNLRSKNLSGFKDAKIFAVETLCSIMKGVKTKGSLRKISNVIDKHNLMLLFC